jgi:predicted AAA+ superfamily ATPase
MIQRIIQEEILRVSKKMPLITITDPRQSGKTTLAKSIFPIIPTLIKILPILAQVLVWIILNFERSLFRYQLMVIPLIVNQKPKILFLI